MTSTEPVVGGMSCGAYGVPFNEVHEVTLPEPIAVGDLVRVCAGYRQTIVRRNGQKIEGRRADLQMSPGDVVTFIYCNKQIGWRVLV
jgi:hypothetical protein